MHIGGAYDLIRNHGNALYDIFREFGALYRVSLSFLQKKIRLEEDEISLVLCYILLKLLRVVLA